MSENVKKILVVDDSALMRRVLCDIINSDKRFKVEARATNGLEAFDLLSRNTYDAVVLDVNMPKMNGLELLEELQKYKIPARVMMASTDTKAGAKTTLDALELGALDFIHKPDNAVDCRVDQFQTNLLRTLDVVVNSKEPTFESKEKILRDRAATAKMLDIVKRHPTNQKGQIIVAIASSTGGPKALQSVIPRLPKELNAPVLVVQHMPKGFTKSLAERLNDISEISVKEAEEGEVIQNGVAYIAMGGLHMSVVPAANGKSIIHYLDNPAREGVKPCANFMYESIGDIRIDKAVCVVMTGMGADGTQGITNLKEKHKTHVIAQDQDSCVVYGMPKCIVNAQLSDCIVPLDQIAQEIILQVGLVTK